MNRKDFLRSVAAAAVAPMFSGCATTLFGRGGRMLFGACRGLADVKLLASIGYDFFESSVPGMLDPTKDDEWWKRQKDAILSQPIPLRSCNGFLPETFRLTGPKANQAPALDYAEKALRRANEVGVKTIVFGSSGARNVPGDYLGPVEQRPKPQTGVAQYTDFCRALCKRIADLNTVVVIEPLCPDESNIVNYVWQGVQICEDVGSPRLCQLADFFHMMSGRESAESIVKAGKLIRHCHVANVKRDFPGATAEDVDRIRPYFDALRTIGYTGGISCECRWGDKKDLAKKFETALKTLKTI